jgi:hypothetical protein
VTLFINFLDRYLYALSKCTSMHYGANGSFHAFADLQKFMLSHSSGIKYIMELYPDLIVHTDDLNDIYLNVSLPDLHAMPNRTSRRERHHMARVRFQTFW